MARFLIGDELGSIKSVSYDAENKVRLETLHDGTSTGRARGIQRLALGGGQLASAHANGTVRLAAWTGEGALTQAYEWRETRLEAGAPFVGLALTHGTVYSCASNGALRRTLTGGGAAPTHELGALPSRLADWRLSAGQETFAYGGEEVEVSVWDTKRAFDVRGEGGTKRKREMFPGEVWRAKNVPDDQLGLRQVVHNTAVTYMASSHQLLAGTRFGDLRGYDTRSGRRPVYDLRGVSKAGGIRTVERGTSEHEAFVSDQGTNLFALDLRTGRIAYGYKGISGAVTSLAVARSCLASASLDRFVRVHSTPREAQGKGAVLDKVYMTTVPTVVVWDEDATGTQEGEGEEEGDIWARMARAD